MDEAPLVQTSLRGEALLANIALNKGSAFTEEERDEFGLRGFLPVHVSTMEEQLARNYENFCLKENPLEQHIFLAALHDRNEVLFYRLLETHITRMMPIIYTPTVGEACQKYSHIFRRARGLYLALPDADRLPQLLESVTTDIEVIVVTDGERILGLGDLGIGGMGIPIGKLALYTLCAGVDPRKTLPVMIDLGTNNQSLLEDPLYLGWKQPRPDRVTTDHYIDAFVKAVKQRWPRAIVQWEDFSKDNAWRYLDRYKNTLPTFNDDIQGTAAVTLAGLLRAVDVAGRSLHDERIVIVGAGSAATGIADLLCALGLALHNFWLVDSQGLVHDGRAQLSAEKIRFAQPLEALHAAGLNATLPISLEAVVKQVRPTALIGTSGQPGIFTESIVRAMASHTPRPIIFPLSNPTSKSEALPEDLITWTEGRALIATGSPFPSVKWRGTEIPIGQCNNAFIFPGVGMGLIATGASHVPAGVFLAAAKTLAAFHKRQPGYTSSLFPNLEDIREVSSLIAYAVGAEIIRAGLAQKPVTEAVLAETIRRMTWRPVYPHLKYRPSKA
jgi:malate dehydrogenase (oxaloacetate-decarboxylating)